MPHARKTGTAWDKRKEDYAYTRDLDGPGWAWEFLRRNLALQRDARMSCAGTPRPIKHVSGATYLRCHRRFPLAERWHLQFFPNPQCTSLETDAFWIPQSLTKHIRVRLAQTSAPPGKCLSLNDFTCHRAVLCTDGIEQVIVRHGPESVTLSAYGLSVLHGSRKAIFEVEGYVDRANKFDALQSLARLAQQPNPSVNSSDTAPSKWRDYLIALDGHLEGRTYRDIAEVIYGSHRIKAAWTDDTRSLKDRVRRAVERGVSLMETGYVGLL